MIITDMSMNTLLIILSEYPIQMLLTILQSRDAILDPHRSPSVIYFSQLILSFGAESKKFLQIYARAI